jgi:tRNA-Thr(GGU) m(6)t(6)A37 methyltransferase TsaA
MSVVFEPIGIIHTPFTEQKGTPIQPTRADGAEGTIEVFEPFRPGLADLDGFSHIVLLYHLDRSSGYKLRVVPYLDTRERGLFATRAPRRPNPIGLSVVELMSIDDGILRVRNVDMLDSTPLLDIKPYVPEFDTPPEIRIGWLRDVHSSPTKRADDRFSES